jgi:hypothetical protein
MMNLARPFKGNNLLGSKRKNYRKDSAEPQSGSDLQPKVAAQRLPWGSVTANLQPQRGCVGTGDKTDATPLEF